MYAWPVYAETLKSGIVTKQGNKYGQTYCTSYGKSRCHPMTQKIEAHDTLSLMFNCDGTLPKMIVDKSKEQSLGEFTRKCREAECHLYNSKTYSPWSHMAGGCIQELKRGSSRKFINTGSPKRLWDHCIELQALIWSHTVHSNYGLDGKVPKTCMNGHNDDISNICKYYWYEWVMFSDQPNNYPYFPVILRRFLGPAIDVVSSMTYKILKANGKYVCRTTVHLLKQTELAF